MTIKKFVGKTHVLVPTVIVFVFIATAAIIAHYRSQDREIALVIGDPWEEMRQRSSAKISAAKTNDMSFTAPSSDARLRFTDNQYGFVTPAARFFRNHLRQTASSQYSHVTTN